MTGVQTCALPISSVWGRMSFGGGRSVDFQESVIEGLKKVIRYIVMNMSMIGIRRGRRGRWLRHDMRRSGGGMGSRWYQGQKARTVAKD